MTAKEKDSDHGGLILDQEIDYHLKQATAHLEIALERSRTLARNEDAKPELADHWSEFLVYLFGDAANERVRRSL